METEKRLIDANAEIATIKENICKNCNSYNGVRCRACWVDSMIGFIDEASTVDAIPIAVMKRAIAGINAADQCDQAGRYDFELRNALRTVLKWYDTPVYKECERRTNGV